jgi:aminoglycoside phosphotransferase (APT) family kinase protein
MTAAARTPPLERAAMPPRPRLWDYIHTTGLKTLVSGASKDPNAKVSLLLVSATTGEPELVVKLPTTDGAAEAVERERQALAGLARRKLGALGETIPRVVGAAEFEGRVALVMTAVRGVPMSTTYLAGRHTARRSRVAADFDAASEWLTDFQARTQQDSPAPRSGIAEALSRRFADQPGIDGVVERVAALEERLAEERPRTTATHGDFWLGNVLATSGRVSGVVDWEAGSAAGNPVADVVRFALMYALYLDRTSAGRGRVRVHRGLRAGEFGAGIKFALDGSGWFPELFRAFVAGGLERVGARARSWRVAVLAGVAEVAASTDDPAFARQHLELFCGLGSREGDR